VLIVEFMVVTVTEVIVQGTVKCVEFIFFTTTKLIVRCYIFVCVEFIVVKAIKK